MERNEATNEPGTPSAQHELDAGTEERARDAVSGAGEKLSSAGHTLRERAGSAKNRLADVLETGAEKLREKSHGASPALAGAADAGTTPIANDGRATQLTDRVAGGMQASAEWLRDTDLDSLRSGIEQQAREHPGRTLLIAAGLGYLVGRAFRGDR